MITAAIVHRHLLLLQQPSLTEAGEEAGAGEEAEQGALELLREAGSIHCPTHALGDLWY